MKAEQPKDLNQVYRKSNVTHRMFNCDYDLIVSPIGKSNGNSDMITIFSSITSIVAVLILLVALLNFFPFSDWKYNQSPTGIYNSEDNRK